ncbi:MAG: DUF4097 family beta strand repeat protein [Ruminococcus sp.]|nr:DUF4097 family beta strand repeat protein [Ruminococcus sp.]
MEHKKRNITGLTFLIMGIIVLVIGIIAVNNTDMSKYKKTSGIKKTDSVQTYNADNVKDIKIEFGTNNYTVIFDENTDKITVDSKGIYENSASVSVDGDTFEYRTNENTILDFGPFKFHFFNLDFSRLADISSFSDIGKLFDEGDGEVCITLPAKDYDDVKIGCGIGNTSIKGNSNSKELKISAGVGNLSIDGLKAKTAKLSAGVGNIKGDNVSFDDFDLSAGIGNIDLRGFVGDTKVSCGTGNVKLTILGSESDYDIDEDDADIHGDGKSNGGDYDLKISSGLGDCDIYFE